MLDAHDERTTNRLAGETSAYLRQHMHNPVDWRPWGPEALAAAEDAGKPLLVSIGYSACHWCHVMERESFEDPDTAALMNRLFVNVKVDREERPDVDQVYMDTVVRLTGSGGWPLTVFCTPDGRPFYGGTYFPPEPRHGMPSFRQVLEAVHDAWAHRRDEVDVSARRILDALRAEPRVGAAAAPGIETLCSAAIQLLRSADSERGGFGGAPKFPTPTNLETLLAAADHLPARKADEALEHVRLSCREMAGRGLYDQLAGGFHRYCVDDHWGVPHFEKMLYDQGQLLRVYAESWRRSAGDDAFAWPAEETAAWLRREMRGPEGAFFASVDADSEGEEGRYYVWTPDEVREVLGEERAAAFCDAYGVRAPGNFEGRSVLWDLAREPRNRFAEERQALREARAHRVPPDTDRKRIAAWNGMTISGLALAGSLFDSPALVQDAVRAADFVLAEMVDDRGRLLRVWNEGTARIPAFLDDHAALLAALLDLHRAGAGERYLLEAGHLAAQIADRFYDPGESDLFLTPVDGERLVHRPRSDHDGATPHSAGLAVLGLLRTATLTGDDELRAVAERVTARHAPYLERVPAAFPTLARAAAWIQEGLGVALIVGAPEAAETRALALRARRALRPDEPVVVAAPERAPKGLDPAWLRGREAREGRATAYVCRGATCSLPITEPEAFAEAIAGATGCTSPGFW